MSTAPSPAAAMTAGSPADGSMSAPSHPSAPDWTPLETALALAATIGFCVAAFLMWAAADAVVPWDSKNHFYPMFRFLGDALSRGEAPLWNPYHFAGHPSVADPQSLLFTPTMTLFAFIAPNASMRVFDAVILAHLAFGGACVVGLCRRWRWRPAGAVLAAIVYMLGGAASARLQHTGMIISYAFFPAALWALDALMERRTIGLALLFGLASGLMTLGRDQVAFLMVMTLAGRVVYAAVSSGAPVAFLRWRAGVFILAGATILAILAGPALLTLQFLDESNRPGIAFGVAAAGSLAPVNLTTLIAPNFFGSIDRLNDYWGPAYDTMARADWTDRAIDYLFIGTFPVVLILWHGLGAGRLGERGGRFFLILAGLALLYGFGRYTPFFALAFDSLPGVSLYRRPADATFILNIALAFGAGYLLHRFELFGLPRVASSRLARLSAGATALAVAAILVAGLRFSWREGRFLLSLEQLGVALAVAALAAGLLVVLRAPRRRALCACLFVALGAGEILWRNAASPLNAEPESRYSVYAQMTPAEAGAVAALRREIAARVRQGDRPRVEILGLPGPWQNASMMLKLENTIGYNPLRIEDYERAVGPGDNAGDPNLRHFPGTFRGYNCRLASLLGLEYLVLDRPLSRLPRHVPRPKATLIYSAQHVYVYRLRDAAPRAYFASRLRPADAALALEEGELPAFDWTREALVDESSLPLVKHAVVERGDTHDVPATNSRVTIVSASDNAVTLDVVADEAGVVVLHDIYYPGWEARVDGEPRPILKTNILFRGVEVPAGRHKVEFAFRPFSIANLSAAVASISQRHD
ncbi:YfhO family protein [Methylocella sp.]|uniref:YfhO family protein n=1 Tax=Methylocella sp. TaxID=1978226 RepID=UPI003784554A